ncbi:hypothetical protein [Paenibacillus sp. GCM10027626]|uniref:hypothetical protein n=1 Tax=Paenibacillus sp. GCM10027626 TaxID=3273411 RepID=UPI00363DBC37
MSNYPVDIANLQQTVLQLQGITSIESGVENLEPIDAEMLPLAACAHLPHATLWRTGGGLKNEVLIQFEFAIEPSAAGLQALEFIAWFVRDCARGGTKLQLRPFALPPETPYGRQLGTTLKFHFDLFVGEIEETLEPAFAIVRELAQKLATAMKLYQIPIK